MFDATDRQKGEWHQTGSCLQWLGTGKKKERARPHNRKDLIMIDRTALINLAALALKGGNLDNAESRYMQLIELENSSFAWSKLGMVKMLKYLSEKSNINEITYCFSIAKTLEITEPVNIENAYLDAVLELTNELFTKIALAADFMKQSDKQLLKSSILAGASFLLSRTQKGGFFGMLGTAQTVYNTASAAFAFKDVHDAKKAIDYCCACLSELTSTITIIVNETNPRFSTFIPEYEKQYDTMKNKVKETTGISLPELFEKQSTITAASTQQSQPNENAPEPVFTQDQIDLMTKYQITFKAGKYHFREYYYDKLEFAVNYAKICEKNSKS